MRVTETFFHLWWEMVSSTVGDMLRKGMNSLIILGAWTLWTHRNKCVFDGTAPNIAGALAVGEDKGKAWSLAGARGLSPPSCHCSGWLGPCLVCFFVSFCVVWPLVPFFHLFNIMMRSSPAFSRKKCMRVPWNPETWLCFCRS